jgi:DNA polymerase-3 subunit epsilon
MYTQQPIIQKVRTKLAQKPVYIDTETTGLRATDEIIEICIVDHDGQILLDSLVKPYNFIPAEATRIHGITNAMVQNAPTWREIWPEVQRILTDRLIGIYNHEFDRRMIKQSHQQAGMIWQELGGKTHTFCIMKLYQEFYGSQSYQKLAKAGQQCGIALPNTHRAKADTLLARAVMNYMGDIE